MTKPPNNNARAYHLVPHTRSIPSDAQHIEPSSPCALSPDTSDNKTESLHISHSTQSIRQFQPRLPIMYNEMALMKLHGRTQIQMLNNISLPLPSDDTNSEWEKSPMAHDSDDEKEESAIALKSDTTEVNHQ